MARMVYVASSLRLRQNQIEDGWVDSMGCIRPDYPCFTVFFVIGHICIVVFYLDI
jgi:hypothetical protein